MSVRAVSGVGLFLLFIYSGYLRGVETELEAVLTASDDRTIEIESSVISVRSERGIGRATIALRAGPWPEVIKIRLFLQGLEGFTLTVGEKKHRRHELQIQAYDKNGSPFGKKYLLDNAGYYEVTIPQVLFAEGAKQFEIHWVNFYR